MIMQLRKMLAPALALGCGLTLWGAGNRAPRPPIRVVVAANGAGNYPTVQEAIDHAPPSGPRRLIIAIEPGIYRGRVSIPRDRPRVTLLGLGRSAKDVVLTYNLSARQVGGTFFSSTVDVEGEGFQAKNLTIQNSYGPGSQAVAISVHAGHAVFDQVRLLGYQDTLYAASGLQYYRDCMIQGAVDFIFGNATAVFDHCQIRTIGHGYITAQSRRSPRATTGYVFYRCRITGHRAKPDVFLGRPWRRFARVVYLDCYLGRAIRPSGWNDWDHTVANQKTAWYGEYGSHGPGAHPHRRARWAHELTRAQARPFFPQVFMRARGWEPRAALRRLERQK